MITYGFNIYYKIAVYVLSTIGLWNLFKKCGIKSFWSIIPVGRNYKLAICADMTYEGRVWGIASLCEIVANIFTFLIESTGYKLTVTFSALLLILYFTFAVIEIIFGIRVYLGLCKMFNHKKGWIILWIVFDSLPILIWGISKKFQPNYKGGIKHSKAAAVRGVDAEVLREGLTINIRKRVVGNGLKKKVLLRDIHFTINPGRMVLLLGGSGAGKTTFINSVTGYEKADANIALNGMDVYKDFEKMKYEIGFVPQQDLIRYQDTVYNTLADAAKLRLPSKTSKKEIDARVNEVMDAFGLQPVRDNLVGKQSGGQKKRISIASEFVASPALYVLDEPDSGLDGILAKDLMRRLNDISRQGKIVIVITHTPDRVLEYFDDVIVLAKDEDRTGRLVYYGPIDDAKKFFGRDSMEEIVKSVNRVEEGGEGRADELIEKFGGYTYGAE